MSQDCNASLASYSENQLGQDKVGAECEGSQECGKAEVADDHERCELTCQERAPDSRVQKAACRPVML